MAVAVKRQTGGSGERRVLRDPAGITGTRGGTVAQDRICKRATDVKEPVGTENQVDGVIEHTARRRGNHVNDTNIP